MWTIPATEKLILIKNGELGFSLSLSQGLSATTLLTAILFYRLFPIQCSRSLFVHSSNTVKGNKHSRFLYKTLRRVLKVGDVGLSLQCVYFCTADHGMAEEGTQQSESQRKEEDFIKSHVIVLTCTLCGWFGNSDVLIPCPTFAHRSPSL